MSLMMISVRGFCIGDLDSRGSKYVHHPFVSLCRAHSAQRKQNGFCPKYLKASQSTHFQENEVISLRFFSESSVSLR